MSPRLLAAIGLFGSLGTALVWGWIIYRRERGWRTVHGRVVEIVSKRDIELQTIYAPCIEFLDPSGRSRCFIHGIYGSERAFRIGQEVLVIFDPDNSENVHLHSIWTKYQPSWLAIFIALCCLLACFFPQT